MTTRNDKPQHEQDREYLAGCLEVWAKSSDPRVLGMDALSRLHTEAAKVPGLEADNAALLAKGRALHDAASMAADGLGYGGRRDELLTALSANYFAPVDAPEKCVICEGSGVDVDTDEEGGTQNERRVPCSRCKGSGRTHPGGALLERLSTAESERDAARQDRDTWKNHATNLSEEVLELRERVATLEAEKSKAEGYVEKLKLDISGHVGVIRQKHEHVLRLQGSLTTAEARVKELEAKLNGTNSLNPGAAGYAVMWEYRTKELEADVALYFSAPPPTGCGNGRDDHDCQECRSSEARKAKWQADRRGAELRLRALQSQPAPAPGLMEAVGCLMPWVKALSRSAMEDDAMVSSVYPFAKMTVGHLRALLAAYDAAKGGGQ